MYYKTAIVWGIGRAGLTGNQRGWECTFCFIVTALASFVLIFCNVFHVSEIRKNCTCLSMIILARILARILNTKRTIVHFLYFE